MEHKTILSITSMAAYRVLKSLEERGIKCSYLGLDQSGRLLMEFNHKAEDKPLLDELQKYMQDCESFINEFDAVLNQIARRYEAKHNSATKLKGLKSFRSLKPKIQENGNH